MEALKDLRRQKGWSQKDLAKISGVGQDTISGIESGRHEPRPSTLRKLAGALDVEVADFFKEPVPLDEAPREAGQSLAEFLNERCGHAYLALPKGEFEEMFDRIPEDAPERRELALEVNREYNTFCDFPKNVTTAERIAMRKMIRDAIPEVAVKHGIALAEGGLDREYQEEAARIFEVERSIQANEDIA